MEDGYQTVRSTLPTLLLSSTGLDQPRLPSLKGIMAAKKKQVETVAASVPIERRLSWDSPQVPAKAVAGTIVQELPASEAAKQLVEWLREQKLI
jgi:electron transfer flavoprotein beta subunit